MTNVHTPHEMDTASDLSLPSLGRTLRLFGRAFTLRCPNCGKGPVLHHLLKLRVKCGTCGMRMQRGEHDSFLGAIFMLFTMASVGLPGTSGFVGEFLSLLGIYAQSSWVALVCTTGIILGAAYMLYLYRRVVFGVQKNEDAAAMPGPVGFSPSIQRLNASCATCLPRFSGVLGR